MPISQSARSDSEWMQRALDLARRAEAMGEVPIGAVLVDAEGQVLGEGWNRVITDADPTAHAEIVALREAASRVNNYRLPDTTLYVTLEPCSMCAGALVNARVKRVVYAADDLRAGAHHSVFEVLTSPKLNHRCEVTRGVLAEESAEILRRFFRSKR
ncbi:MULTISPECIES: tRNA adenosine(34) deaminase TadA [unclassified Wenzhouxiangella]|uniref:tRNA adenosine(34) deaminase TadA n=1 Tax=unclassified Wenzhouxiangella TaxID=2613841 RepID=UPI000E326912|nr:MULTISPECIES: tRNA adenosine(34) deaminase TadA [unclassified Wenzhouxiangella]RFF26765.1 tRNA adenosine(34) deaminase TadA [Wenzhouxiangella sp. 15181]RFP67729.1 tRNA adenosine(34) deaminase TadA [Wenzhouxiangella sp. 15190]